MPGVLEQLACTSSGRPPTWSRTSRRARRRSRRSLASRTNSCAMFTPNGLSVRSRILRISSRTSSSCPEERLDDPEPAGIRDGRRELGPGDVAHRRLHDRVLDPQHLSDSCAHAWHATHMTTPVIIEAALNGVTRRKQNPHVPLAPDEQTAGRARVHRRGRNRHPYARREHRGRARRGDGSVRGRVRARRREASRHRVLPDDGSRCDDPGSIRPRRAARRPRARAAPASSTPGR